MKLGSKIILGFVAVCAIFGAIIGVVIYSLVGVKSDTLDLQSRIMPGNDLSAGILASATLAGLNILDFSYSSNEASFKKFQTFDAETVESFEGIRKLVQAGLASGHPAIRDLIASAEQQYLVFQSLANQLPGQMKKIIEARTTTLNAHTALSSEVTSFRQSMLKQLDELADSELISDMDNLRRRVMQLESSVEVMDSAGEFYINMLRGLYYQDPLHFSRSIDQIKTLLEQTRRMLERTVQQSNRDSIGRIVTQAEICLSSLTSLHGEMETFLKDKELRERAQNLALDTTGKLADSISALTHDFAESTMSSLSHSFTTMITGSLLAIIISGVLAILLMRNITVPVNRVISALACGAQEVDQASGELSSASNTLAEGATENAASLEETSAALEELSSMTRRNSDNAMEANALMDQATLAVAKAETSMTSVIAA
ncbi:MAG: hypothetical protein LBK52_07625, partial [Deltaproteobacteria bacterium]|nr:hypothetical protein [Deltaproteobacteria bacterium]